jgi:mono/diheme cytochrome c family protein
MKKSLFTASLMVLGILFVFVSFVVGVTPAQASVSSQSSLVEHGKYIATIAGCTDCHTNFSPEFLDPTKMTLPQIQTVALSGKDAMDNDMFLAGGRLFDLGPGGKVYTANLTSDVETGIGGWTDEQIKTAIRTGQRPSGRMLVPVMPYRAFNTMADLDLNALVAYLRTIPPVKNKVPEPTFSTEGMQPLPFTQGITTPDASDKTARGEYLLKTITGCTDCHTPLDPATGAPMMDKYLAGGQPYVGPWGTVYGGNITPDVETGIGSWTEQEIKVAFLTGVNNQGRRLILMPWFAYSALSNDDADALAYYIKNKVQPIHNKIPAAALEKDFTVLAPKPDAGPNMPLIIGIAVVVLLVLIFGVLLLLTRRKKPAA